MRFTVGSLFAGMGGFCLAFEKSGFKVCWANESDRGAQATYSANFPHVHLYSKSIKNLSVIGDKLECVDVLTGGFPCQPFSVAGAKSGFSDPRGELFFDIVRLLKEFGPQRPKVVLLENVAHLLNHDNGRTFGTIMNRLQAAGYWFTEANAQILDTSIHTSIPQGRQRLYMVAASTTAFAFNPFKFPHPVGKTKKFRTFLDLNAKQDPWHYFTPESRWGKLFQEAMGKGNPQNPYQLRRSYVRELKNGLVPTLMANMGGGGHNQPVIKDRWGIRKLSVRECLRLQGFDPDSYRFPKEVSEYGKYRQVGNSVTVPLVQTLATECRRILEEHAGRTQSGGMR